ncbi:MAG: V-type ATPase subunit [Victivallales bacterium]|nr:V-type ATPase subunit [Victivallales bacterium]
MSIPNTNASHDFIFAKLHGLWANAIRGDALEKLLRSGTPEVLQRNLHDVGIDASRREGFHRNLLMREFNTLSSISRLLDDRSSRYYHAIMSKGYFEDLKTILHYRFFPEHNIGIEEMLTGLPGAPTGNVRELMASKSTEGFLEGIVCDFGVEKELLASLVAKLDKEHDIMQAECALDQAHYDFVMKATAAAPLDIGRAATDMTATEIDMENICMLLRNIRTYHLADKRMASFWLKGGLSLSPERLSGLLSSRDVKEAVSQLPPGFQRLLEPFTEAELYLSENALWNHLYDKALRLFRDFDTPSLSIVAYPFLLRFETQNVSRIYEGVRFGIPARDMRDMMIGAHL